MKTISKNTSETMDASSVLPHIVRTTRDDGVVVLTFDHPDSSANIFDETTLTELEEHLSKLDDASGLVLISAKPSIFVAGADLNALSRLRGAELIALIKRGQRVFTKIAELPIPTVAAIHGACVGGGLEMALACDWRIASSEKVTKIGLPETLLGILPAWGGCTRLPRLIGLPNALKFILGGKTVSSAHARKLGIIDHLAPKEHLLLRASQLIGETPERSSHWLTNNAVASRIAESITEKNLTTKSRGNYPALEKALDVICRGVSLSLENSLRNERDAVVGLAETESTRNLMRVFFLQEKARKLRLHPEVEPRSIGQAAVIGSGVMGSGIAQWLASRELPTVLQDIDKERVAAGMETAKRLFEDGVKRRIFTQREAKLLLDRIAPVDQPVPLNRADLVIEAAVEDFEIKQKIFTDLCARTRSETILATNTSALPIGKLQVTHPERLVGLHFFNPVHRMKLVEIVVTDQTNEETVETMLRFVRHIGKLPVVVRDRPGFLVNRLLMPYLIEAGRLVERGISPRKVDEALLDFGMPMGPIRLLDEIGLDVALHVSKTMAEHFGERFEAPEILKRLVNSGHLGKKSGGGFYEADLPAGNPAPDFRDPEIAERLALLMANEGFRVLEENVAQSEDDIDFAMIQGTGFAPFRGGPMTWARFVGLPTVVKKLNTLAHFDGESFKPAPLLISAAKPKKFLSNP